MVLCGGVLVALIAIAIPDRVRVRRLDRCTRCRYDLTGNQSGICPECGEPTPAEPRHRRDAELAPLAEAIEQTRAEPSCEDDQELVPE